MENNVVTLETAKKLKAAGFPQNSAYTYVGFDPGGELPYRYKLQPSYMEIDELYFAAPTAQEVADQLPELIQIDRDKGYWFACRRDTGQGRRMLEHGEGTTMAEALAALWLKLREGENHATRD